MNDPNAMETPPPLSKAEQLLHLQTLQAGMISPPVFKTQVSWYTAQVPMQKDAF